MIIGCCVLGTVWHVVDVTKLATHKHFKVTHCQSPKIVKMAQNDQNSKKWPKPVNMTNDYYLWICWHQMNVAMLATHENVQATASQALKGAKHVQKQPEMVKKWPT